MKINKLETNMCKLN